jgi:hypothetical protein
VEGTSALDESMVTGEAIAVEKQAGARVIGATINGSGSLIERAEAERVGSDTMLAQKRSNGVAGATEPRTYPETGGPSRGILRSHRHGDWSRHVRCMEHLGTRA